MALGIPTALAQPVEPAAQVAAVGLGVQGIPFTQQGRQGTAQVGGAQGAGVQQQLAQAWVHPQAGQLAAMAGEGPGPIDGPEGLQERLALQQVGPGGRIQPGQGFPQAGAPLGQLQHQGRRIGIQ